MIFVKGTEVDKDVRAQKSILRAVGTVCYFASILVQLHWLHRETCEISLPFYVDLCKLLVEGGKCLSRVFFFWEV